MDRSTVKKFLVYAKQLVNTVVYFFVLSPRIAEKIYNPVLFDDDEKGTPVTSPPSFDDVEHKQVLFPTVDGTLLNSWFFRHPTSANVLLFNIGRAGDIQQKLRHVRFMLDAGISVFVFEYRGFGASPETPTCETICQDGIAAYDYLVNTAGYSCEHIVIFGESLGAAVAAHTSSKRPSRALIMQSGFISLEREAKDLIKPLRVIPSRIFPVPNPPLNNLAIVEQPHPTLLLIHGVFDPIIPVYHAKVLFAGAQEQKKLVLLPNSKHSDLGMAPEDIPLFQKTITDFIAALS